MIIKGYSVTSVIGEDSNYQEVSVAFHLAYHDWLKLENSNEWLNFLEKLASFQKE